MTIEVKGKPVDDHTRCVHWHSQLDIIALKFKCCESYFPCYECHKETAGHEAKRYNLRENPDLKCILCGNCNAEMTFSQYSSSLKCIDCNSKFNPACASHYHLYFDEVPRSCTLK